jgi:AraC-like DNA-binding protein
LTEVPAVLISADSAEPFRKGMNEIMIFVVIIGTSVLLAGLAASGFFSRKLYQPLKQLMASVGTLSQTAERQDGNEYSYLQRAINLLSDRASEYERTFNDNLKIMRYGFLQSLFNNQFSSRSEIEAKIRFLNLSLEGPHFRIIRIFLSGTTKTAADYDLIAYNILAHTESLGASGDISLYGIKNSGLSLSVLCAYRDKGPFRFKEAVDEILRYCQAFFSISAQICAGEELGDLADIGRRAGELERIEEYLFFSPQTVCLSAQDIPALTAPRELPPSLMDEFEAALNRRSFTDLCGVLENFRSLCGSLEYPAESCRRYLLLVVQVFSRYLKKHRAADTGDEEHFKAGTSENIDAFCSFMKAAAAGAFEYIGGQPGNRNALLASKLKEYLQANLRSMISLDSTAADFALSSGYVSRLIKEETGDSFVDYLNKLRLEAAMTMLGDSSLKIEDIARRAGFNSSGYFIKRFKARYGFTPKAWRLQNKIETH